MIPETRIDFYLADITDDPDAGAIPEPVTRIDTYLAHLCGETVVLPEPVTRIDHYLAQLCGADVVIDEPVTRIDHYLASLCGMDVEIPEPVTRIDHYLYNWANGGGLPDWQTFTGNPLQFNAPKAHTLRSVKVEFSPQQAGTGDPSPDNIRPISGWTGTTVWGAGENLYPYEKVAKYSWDFSQQYTLANAVNPVYLKANTVYTFSIDEGNKLYRMRLWDSSGTLIENPANFATLVSGTSNGFSWYDTYKFAGYSNFSNATNVCQITPNIDIWFDFVTQSDESVTNMLNLGSTASPYSPYTGRTISVTWTDEAGTVYGGTYNFVTGVLTGTMAEVDLGTLTWAKNDSSLIGVPCFYATVPSVKAGAPYIACSDYVIKRDRNSINGTGQISPGNSSDATYCVIRDDRYATIDATAFKTAVSAVQLVYELATPVTYHLPSLEEAIRCIQGINTMWTDADSLEVEARANAVQLNALQSLNMLLGGRYYNNGGADEPTDEEALNILLGGNER